MKAKKEIPAICEAVFGRLPERSAWVWQSIADLERTHKSSAVVLDFRDWAAQNAGDDFPKGIMKAYLDVASDRLSFSGPVALQTFRSPEAINLSRELSVLSGGDVAFSDKHRARLSELLQEYSSEEILGAWKAWAPNQDSDPKFLAGNFVQAADNLCYAARRREKERKEQEAAHDATRKRLQEEAEAERRLAEQREREQADLFDPIAG